jgi:quercetin dioxygenase-like cupin family protein
MGRVVTQARRLVAWYGMSFGGGRTIVSEESESLFISIAGGTPMAIPHAKPGEKISVRPLGRGIAKAQTHTLIKTDTLEVIRLVVPAGKALPTHKVAGEITVQCLEGRVAFIAGESTEELAAGELLYLAGNEPHWLRGIEDATVVVTILLR